MEETKKAYASGLITGMKMMGAIAIVLMEKEGDPAKRDIIFSEICNKLLGVKP